MRRWLLFCFLTLSASDAARAAIEASAGHGLFRTAADSAYLQLYWEIGPQSLHYKLDTAGRLTSRVRTQLRVSGDTGVVYKDVFYLQTKPFRQEAEPAPRILEQERIPLRIGTYVVELFLSEDGRSDSRFYYRDTFSVGSSVPQYSSLQLLDTIFSSTIPSPFLKDGYQQLPRALNFYDEGQRLVHTYLELYHTSELPPVAFPLRQTIYLSKRPGERINTEEAVIDSIKAGAPIHAFRHSLSTAAMPTGNYWVNASLRTATGIELVTAATFFQTINKKPIEKVASAATNASDTGSILDANFLDLGKTFVAKFNMAQLRAILKMIRPGAGGTDESVINTFLEHPDELYTRYFIYNHFAGINKQDPGKAWKDFSDVIREVNKRFGAGGIPGYETDRGIMYLRYGKPDEEVRVPNEAGAVPYEIWRYNPNPKMHGPGLFLFYSPGAMSSGYRLLHSTVVGELQNPEWRSMLYGTGRSSGNMNARAEEYFRK
jgi:GWxTD domain-containing protein